MLSSLARCRWKLPVMFRDFCPMSLFGLSFHLHVLLLLSFTMFCYRRLTLSCSASSLSLSLFSFHPLVPVHILSVLDLVKSCFGSLTCFFGTFSAYAALIFWIIRSVCTLSFNECLFLHLAVMPDLDNVRNIGSLVRFLLMLSSFVLRLAQRFSFFSLHAGECMLLLLICRLWLLHDCASLVAVLYSIVVCLFTDTRMTFWLFGCSLFEFVLVWALSAYSALNIDLWSMIHLVGLAHVNSCSE